MALAVVSRDIIDDILAKYGQVSKLNLSNNGIRIVENMENMTELEKLDMSYNEIINVEGVATLPNLVDLNLRGNKISNANCLGLVPHLEHLDLSDNDISSLEALRALSRSGKLTTLCLAGNPISQSTLVYPHAIFATIPTLQLLDNKTLQQHLNNEHSTPSSAQISHARATLSPARHPAATTLPSSLDAQYPASPFPSPVQSPSSQEAFLRHKIGLLEAELIAHEKMWASQEEVLGEAAKKAALRSGAVEMSAGPSSRKDDILYRRNVSEFGYDALLAQWRKQTHKCMVQQLLREKDMKATESDLSRVREECQKKNQASNLEINSLKTSLKAAHALIEEQQIELEGRRSEVEFERREKEVAQDRAKKMEAGFGAIRRFLESYRDKIDREMVSSNVIEMKMTKKLMTLEGRLEATTQRVMLLSTLLEQKEVQLRNSEAALVAERRLFWLRSQHHQGEQNQQQSRSFRTGGTAGGAHGGSGGVASMSEEGWVGESKGTSSEGRHGESRPEDNCEDGSFVSDVSITPELEALLRSLFRQLDPQDTGAVSCRLLLKCLESVAVSGLLKCPPGSGARKRHNRSSRDALLTADSDSDGIVHSSLWSLLVGRLDALVGPSSADDEAQASSELDAGSERITWGEFLLLLVPDAVGHPDQGTIPLHRRREASRETAAPFYADMQNGLCMCENCQLCVWRSSDNVDPRVHRGTGGARSPVGDSKPTGRSIASQAPGAVAGAVFPRRSISGREFMSMHKSRLLEDCLWAMVPLQIPSAEELDSVSGRVNDKTSLLQPSSWLYNLAASSGSGCSCVGCGDCRDSQRLKREVLRLARERAFLLDRIQKMGRSLERRAEGIKGFFDSELRKADIKLSRSKHDLSEAQARVAEVEGRLAEMQSVFRIEKEAYEQRVGRLEHENSELREEAEFLANKKDSRLLEQIDEQAAKCIRLESELRILRKELSKTEVNNKALQRDIMRHQTTASSTQDMLVELQSQHVEAEQRLSALTHEKTRLLERVVEAENELEALRSAAAEVRPNDSDQIVMSMEKACQTAADGEEHKASNHLPASHVRGTHDDHGICDAYPDRADDGAAGRAADHKVPGQPSPQPHYYSPPPYPSRYPHQQQGYYPAHEEDGGSRNAGRPYAAVAPPPGGGYNSSSLDSVVRKLRVMAEQLNQDE